MYAPNSITEGVVLRFSRSLSYLIVVFVVSLSFPAVSQTSQPVVASAIKVSIPVIHISNFGRISANYFRGAQPAGNDYKDLAALGVKTVINLTSDDGKADEQQMVESAGMKYVHMPMSTHKAPTVEQIREFLSIVGDSASEPVYVHCVGGKHRTGVMTAVYRMEDDGWSPDQAFKEMKLYKFGMDFLHPEFKSFVYSYRSNHVVFPRSSAEPSSRGTEPVSSGYANGPLQ